MENDSEQPTLESLLREMIANQQSIYDMVSALYERIDKLEKNLSNEIAEQIESGSNEDSFFSTYSGEDGEDDLYEDAVEAVRAAGKASTSYLQRKLRIGYSRAARLMDLLEEGGVIGPQDGSKPRELLIQPEDE